MKRESGILLHISSLPSKYGIGDFGKSAYNFVDFLSMSKQRNWQILPLNMTSYGDSPYQSFSAFAGNPYFIDLDELIKLKLITNLDIKKYPLNDNTNKINYGLLYKNKYKLLRIAYSNNQIDLSDFYYKHYGWLRDFALFMALKQKFNDKSWDSWDSEYKQYNSKAVLNFEKENQEEIFFWVFTQYHFLIQYEKLKAYANKNNVEIIGDIPIYVAYDSVDVWANTQYFKLDKDYQMLTVAGVPPDDFSKDGQLWGNPIYRWENLKKDNYNWWIRRLKHSLKLYDKVRLDHFRGFASFCEIDAKKLDAKEFVWTKGPGMDLFNEIFKQIPNPKIIVEDLGLMTKDVIKLVKDSGFPNIKVLVFALNSINDSEHLVHNYYPNMVGYTSTHDNETVMGVYKKADLKTKKFLDEYFKSKDQDFNWAIIKTLFKSSANLAIVNFQDLLGLDNKYRMNSPGKTLNNWNFVISEKWLDKDVANKLKNLTLLYFRY